MNQFYITKIRLVNANRIFLWLIIMAYPCFHLLVNILLQSFYFIRYRCIKDFHCYPLRKKQSCK
jgi:hypothetical protein